MTTTEGTRARLSRQISGSQVILFTGAGFSGEARDSRGEPLPNSSQLARELWDISFPDRPFDPTTHLGDAFEAAKVRNRSTLASLLERRLSVQGNSLPDFYRVWFSVPWIRCYTLNIDDIEQAVARRFGLGRDVLSLSATTERSAGRSGTAHLEVVHLNGLLGDSLDSLTFSDLDYGLRLTSPERWYGQCIVDMATRPVVFVGTELNESPLWQYVQHRRSRRSRGLREMRPGSYLVCPSLNPARAETLRELNIEWIPMTAQRFAEELLQAMAPEIREGHSVLSARAQAEGRRRTPQLVLDLAATEPMERTEYLLGYEPTWGDLRSGKAIERDCDLEVFKAAEAILAGRSLVPLVITGTAGSGKSTSLMRLGLRLGDEGIPAYWIDEESNVDPSGLRQLVRGTEGAIAILVDDADVWGALTLSGWARELPTLRPGVLFAVALRSSRVDPILRPDLLGDLKPAEIAMPPLSDSDIEALIALLERENRLGVMLGMNHTERVQTFRRHADRQLLVAMMEATSGEKFDEKVISEFEQLDEHQRLLYAITCVVFSQRYTVDRQELLLAAGSSDLASTNALEALASRHIIVRRDLNSGYRPRHRMIAEVVVSGMEFRPYVEPVLEGVCRAFAMAVSPDLSHTDLRWRRLTRFMNHDYLLHLTTADTGRRIYDSLEDLLKWDYHYWLQRGSLEVESGNLGLATNFLRQARSIRAGDRLVQTEWAYLLMKKAARQPTHVNADSWFGEGKAYLEELIGERGKVDYYPYHVLGSQGLGWVRQAAISLEEKRALLRVLLTKVQEGVANHPRREELKDLAADLQREWLSTAVRQTR